MAGNAVKDAGMKLRALLFEAASEKLGVPVERLATAFRRVYDSRDPEKFISFIEAANLAEGKHGTLVAAGSYKPPAGIGGGYKGGRGGPAPPGPYPGAGARECPRPPTRNPAVANS